MAKRAWTAAKKTAMLAKIRTLCASFPQATERPSHGSPTWFVGDKRSFATVTDNHHSDGRFALWCAAPDGAMRMLVDSEPDQYFAPPYVARLGSVGVHLDRAPWKAIDLRGALRRRCAVRQSRTLRSTSAAPFGAAARSGKAGP